VTGKPDYGVMRREQLAIRLAMTYHQLNEQRLEQVEAHDPGHTENLIQKWLPVAEMAIHETLE